MRVRSLLAAFVTTVSVSLAGAETVLAQTTGSVFGTVQDESEAVVPGAAVTVKNVETGLTRAAVADADGRFEVPSLPPGEYEIQVELMGFQTAVRKGIVLTIGREAKVDFTVKVGDVTETLVVTGEAPLVDTRSTAMSQVVDSKQIQELPLNARDFVQLATLQPGVAIVDTGATVGEGGSSGAAGRGLGVKLTISGARTNSNAFLLDGTDVNDYANTTPGSITGANLGVEAIREFRVLTNTYSAEYGRSAGGVIVAVSRSGTNDYHGSVFEFHRNSEMDAANYFDKAVGREKPDFSRNQFGGAIGGPIARNKLFFFGNYEGQRSVAGSTEIATVMTEQARRGQLSAALGGPVAVDPSVAPFLPLWPLPNGTIRAGGDTGDFISTAEADISEDFVVAKVDHQLSTKHNYFVRHTLSDASNIRPNNLQVSTVDAGSTRNFTTFDWKTILSPALLNSATFAFNRTDVFNGLLTPIIDVPEVAFIAGRPMGFIDVGTITSFPGGVGASDQDSFDYRVLQIRDDITWSRGIHGLKFGFNIERIMLDMDSTSNINGGFSFGSIRDFLLNRPSTFAGTVPGSDAARRYRQGLYGFYVQDDMRLSSRLTVNAGLRYEFISEISEVDGKVSALRNFTDPAFTVGRLFENPSLKNFAPRIGIAWDPKGDGTTAVRAGFGIFHDQILTHYFSGGTGVRNPPHFQRVTFGTEILRPGDFPFGAGPKLEALANQGVTTGEWLEYTPEQPTAMQFNLNVQRQMPGDFVVMAGYVGYDAQNLKRTAQDGNLRVPVRLPDGRLFFNHATANPCPIAACFDSPRENPNFLLMRTAALDGESSYHAVQVGMNKRFQAGLQFQTSYTYGKAIDDSSGVFNESDLGNSNLYPYFADPRFNRGLADFDVRHTLMVNYTYDLPVRLGGIAGAILNGWQSSGILRASAGQPYTVVLGSDQAQTLSARGAGGQRPSVPEGHDGKVESTGDPNGWFDRTQFVFPAAGFLGNLGRGSGTGDNLITFDTTLSKNIYFTGSRYLQVRADLFNAFNESNFSNPGRPAVFDRQGRINQTAGRITSTSIRNRQVQLSLKFYF